MERLREIVVEDLVPGRLWLSAMPGRPGAWTSLAATLRVYRTAGVERVVCLAPDEEIRAKSPEYAAALRTLDFPWPRLVHPVPDGGVPDDPAAFRAFVDLVAGELRDGCRIVVHCGAGVGRSGLVAACLLTRLGLPPEEALRRVRDAEAGPETDDQTAFFHTFAAAGDR